MNIYHKSNNEQNKFKYNNTKLKRFLNKNISDELDESDFLLNKISEKERENSSYGIEKINIEINQKSNNSNVEINPKNLLKEANKEKDSRK